MSFNRDVSEQGQEVLFSCKKNINNHRVFFNSLPINKKSTQKQLGLLLDKKLIFSEHINKTLKKRKLRVSTQPAITSPKLTKETLEQGVKHVQSNNKDTRMTMALFWYLYC